jgi:hypothetical protein
VHIGPPLEFHQASPHHKSVIGGDCSSGACSSA